MSRRRVAATAALVLSIASLTPLAAHAASSGATTYYVSDNDSTCSDTNPGTEALPFCTIAEAAATATTPGDTVLIEQGDYSGHVEVTASGTAADPITFEAVDQSPTAIGATLFSSASSDTYGLYLDGASYIDVSGISFAGYASSAHSVEIEDSSHITLSRVSTSESVSVDGDSADVTLSRIEAQGGSSGAAIAIDSSGTGNVVTTSLAEDGAGGAAGITVQGSADAVITSNTVTQYCGAGISIGDDTNGTATGATVENNVISTAYSEANDENVCDSTATAGISIGSAADESGLTANYNDVYPADNVDTEVYDWVGVPYSTPAALDAATGQGAADSIANPEITGDGRALNESSSVINAANSNAPDELSTDFDGNARVYDPNVPETGAGTNGYDRGAIQFVEAIDLAKSVSFPITAPQNAAVTIDAPVVTDNWANATYTYTYDFGDGSADVTTADTSVTHTFTSTGAFPVTVTVVSGYGATLSSPGTITVKTPVAFSASLTASAYNELDVDTDPEVTTDWPITSQTINFGDGTSTQPVTTDPRTTDHGYTEPGTYTITYTVADAGGDSTTVTTSFTTVGNDFTPIAPTRLLDTRKNLGGTEKALADDGSIVLKVAGVGGIPANVTAVDLNLTAVGGTGAGYIEANTGSDNGTSNLNYGANLIYSNSVIAQVSTAGTVTLRNFATSKATEVNLIADATGYFSPTQADRFDFVTPSRLLDTRTGVGGSKGALGADKTDVLTVDGAGGLPASGVAAVSVNLTVTGSTDSGYLVAYADGTAVPGTSDVDWQGGTTKAASVLVPVGSDGQIDIHNGSSDGGATNVLVDVTGYFTASATGDVYVPVTPLRVLDTRKTASIAAGTAQEMNLAGADGMPSPETAPLNVPFVDGYVLNATATATEQAGWLQLSNGQSGTSTSTVNWTGPGQTVANLAFTEGELDYLIDDGSYLVYVHNGSISDPVQAIVDVMGYFSQG